MNNGPKIKKSNLLNLIDDQNQNLQITFSDLLNSNEK